MAAKRAPFLVRALSGKEDEDLAADYELEAFFCGGDDADEFVRWLMEYEEVVAARLHYRPAKRQLERWVAPVLARDRDFESHLLAKGLQWDRDHKLADRLARMGAAILTTRLYDLRRDYGS